MKQFTSAERRERARAYFARCYGADHQEIFDDRMNRYDANFNGAADHLDRVLPFILGETSIPLNESRGRE